MSSIVKKKKVKAKTKAKKVKKACPPKKPKLKRACPKKPCLKPNILKDCRSNVAFILNDNRKLRNIVHLIDELENMNDDVFYSHVTEFKNDFSNWFRDVFKDDVIADELHLINDRFETQRALLKHTMRTLLKGVKK